MRDSKMWTPKQMTRVSRNVSAAAVTRSAQEAGPVLVVSSICTSYEAPAQISKGVLYHVATTELRLNLE